MAGQPDVLSSVLSSDPIASRIVVYLHDLVLELGQEEVDDLVLLDGQGVQVDLLHALDLASLDQTAQLGDGLPLLLLALAAATATATATTASTITSTATIAKATTGGGSTTTVSHDGVYEVVGGDRIGRFGVWRDLSKGSGLFASRVWRVGG